MEEALPHPIEPSAGEEARLKEAIQQGLRSLKDPETGLDVVRMGLVRNLQVEKEGSGCKAILVFRPSSPVCPMAFKLAWDIKQCAGAVDGIRSVEIRVQGYNRAAELEKILQGGDEE